MDNDDDNEYTYIFIYSFKRIRKKKKELARHISNHTQEDKSSINDGAAE